MANREVNLGFGGTSDELVIQQSLEDSEGGASATVRPPIKTEIHRMMMTDAAQSVLQSGYTTEIVQKAIERLLMTEGSAGMTANRIIDAIDSIETERGRMELPSASGGAEIAANEINKHETEGGANANATICRICHVNTICVVFLPCGHLLTCRSCYPKVRDCPVCGSYVKATVNAYFG